MVNVNERHTKILCDYKEWILMYQSYLYFEANTCLQEMAHWRRCAVRTTHTKINSVWFMPHLPNFNHHVCQTMNILYLNFHMCGSTNFRDNEYKLKTDFS